MVSLLCNPSRREANTHCQKIQASAQVWQAVLLPMSLWSHTADSLSPRLRTDCPLWFELSMQPWYMLGLCGVFFTHTHTHTHTSWKDQPVEHESCPTAGSLPDEEGLPSHLPLPWPALQTGRRQWGCPWKKPWIYFIIPCSQTTIHGYHTGIRLFYSVDSHSDCADIKCCWSLWGNYHPQSKVLNKSVLSKSTIQFPSINQKPQVWLYKQRLNSLHLYQYCIFISKGGRDYSGMLQRA